MDDATPPADATPSRVPPRLIVLVFAAIFGALAWGYWFFLSGTYAPAFTGLRPAEASAVTAQLSSKGIAYRLRNGGATIQVPSDQVDTARVAIAGSDLPTKGAVGFELFNKSDMGLTDFAQRINYQRALQGELERSIMMLDDVESARVHLAMPERTLFRNDRSAAKAAVELVGRDGRQFEEARVAGIQRLVANAVPDLAPADVVVLDANGKVLSTAAMVADSALTPEAEEQRAVSSYYRARIRAAVGPLLAGVEFEVKVLVARDAPIAAATTEGPGSPAASDSTGARKFGLRISVATPVPLNPEERAMAQSAIATAVGYDTHLGDTLSFETGIGGGTAPPLPVVNPSAAAGTRSAPAPAAEPSSPPTWLLGSAGVIIALGIAALLVRRRPEAGTLSDAERSVMLARLRASLREAEPAHG